MKLKANLILLLTASIWGFAFVAQRVGANYVGSFTFNGIRFALGSLSLLPLILFQQRHSRNTGTNPDPHNKTSRHVGMWAGLILFIAASLQQIGMNYTTAGKAAFITGLYIIFVPIIGICLKQHITGSNWLGCALALFGLYFLSIKENFSISYGDMLQLIGAIFWSVHILLIDHFSHRTNTIMLAFFQFLTCSLLSLGTAMFWETINLKGILEAGIPLLYGGICSVGIAYTLQIIGQKSASPAHASIILSMETVFAALGGYLILHEHLQLRELLGCALMMAGMLISQLQIVKPRKNGTLGQPAKLG